MRIVDKARCRGPRPSAAWNPNIGPQPRLRERTLRRLIQRGRARPTSHEFTIAGRSKPTRWQVRTANWDAAVQSFVKELPPILRLTNGRAMFARLNQTNKR